MSKKAKKASKEFTAKFTEAELKLVLHCVDFTSMGYEDTAADLSAKGFSFEDIKSLDDKKSDLDNLATKLDLVLFPEEGQ